MDVKKILLALLIIAAIPAVILETMAAPGNHSKRPRLQILIIHDTGWRTASGPTGFNVAANSLKGTYQWERSWLTQDRSASYQEVIELTEPQKDWSSNKKENIRCAYGGSKVFDFSEGSNHGKRTYSWSCIDRTNREALVYEAHYSLYLGAPSVMATIEINYVAVVRSKIIDFAKFQLKSLPGLESYRAFKGSLAPINPVSVESNLDGVVPLLR